MNKVVIKNSLIIFHGRARWLDIYSKILKDYGMGMAVRTRLRRELGFTYRYHRGLVPNPYPRKDGPSMLYEEQVHLDFYSQSAQSWFELKYLNLSNTSLELDQ